MMLNGEHSDSVILNDYTMQHVIRVQPPQGPNVVNPVNTMQRIQQIQLQPQPQPQQQPSAQLFTGIPNVPNIMGLQQSPQFVNTSNPMMQPMVQSVQLPGFNIGMYPAMPQVQQVQQIQQFAVGNLGIHVAQAGNNSVVITIQPHVQSHPQVNPNQPQVHSFQQVPIQPQAQSFLPQVPTMHPQVGHPQTQSFQPQVQSFQPQMAMPKPIPMSNSSPQKTHLPRKGIEVVNVDSGQVEYISGDEQEPTATIKQTKDEDADNVQKKKFIDIQSSFVISSVKSLTSEETELDEKSMVDVERKEIIDEEDLTLADLQKDLVVRLERMPEKNLNSDNAHEQEDSRRLTRGRKRREDGEENGKDEQVNTFQQADISDIEEFDDFDDSDVDKDYEIDEIEGFTSGSEEEKESQNKSKHSSTSPTKKDVKEEKANSLSSPPDKKIYKKQHKTSSHVQDATIDQTRKQPTPPPFALEKEVDHEEAADEEKNTLEESESNQSGDQELGYRISKNGNACHEKIKVECKICHNTYCSSYIRLHTKYHCHKKHRMPRAPCQICHKIVAVPFMKKHLRVHAGEKLYFCPICGQGFPAVDTLRAHEGTHSDERTHSCKYCKRQFKRRRNLRIHELRHTSEPSFQCKYCPMRFYVQSSFSNHLHVHKRLKGRKYKCPDCGNHFLTRQHLERHRGKYCMGHLTAPGAVKAKQA